MSTRVLPENMLFECVPQGVREYLETDDKEEK